MPAQQGPRVAVVVCCRDRSALLAEALPAVRAELQPGDELVVVDSASRSPEVGLVASSAGALVERLEAPGLSRARNRGWRAAQADLLLFTDDDCRPLPGWRAAAVGAFDDVEVGAVWGTVLADRDSPVPLSVGLHGLAEVTADSDMSLAGHGACMAFRRQALEQVGGFDELLGAGGRFRAAEDKDGFWRVHRSGWRVVAAPAMAVTHVVHRDDRQARTVMRGYGVGTGALVRKRHSMGDPGPLLRRELWRHGLLPAYYWAKERRGAASVASLARAAGVLAGWWTTRDWEVRDGHLVAPER